MSKWKECLREWYVNCLDEISHFLLGTHYPWGHGGIW